jgi:hypothetical protein
MTAFTPSESYPERVVTPAPGDIVIPTSGLDANSAHELLARLADMGISGAFVGSPMFAPQEAVPGFDHLQDHVGLWKYLHGTSVDPRYLENVIIDEDLGSTVWVVTDATFRSVFQILHGDNRSTYQSATRIHKQLMRMVQSLQARRSYLQNGAVYMGEHPRASGYAWNQTYWGLLTLESGGSAQRPSYRTIGETSIARIHMLLGQISDMPVTDETVRQSGWDTA